MSGRPPARRALPSSRKPWIRRLAGRAFLGLNRDAASRYMKVFLTGATGFVGHHVARALAGQGAELRLLTRKTSNLGNLEGIPGETHVGDLAQPESLRPGLAGC